MPVEVIAWGFLHHRVRGAGREGVCNGTFTTLLRHFMWEENVTHLHAYKFESRASGHFTDGETEAGMAGGWMTGSQRIRVTASEPR